jgi:hypothetical protein
MKSVTKCSARHNQSPFKAVKLLGQGNILHNMQASLRPHFIGNSKPRVLVKPLRVYGVKDSEPCTILARTYHSPWKSHMVTQRDETSELTLVRKLKMNLSEVNGVLNLVWYLHNPHNATFF